MTSDQWFELAHVFLLVALSCFAVPALMFAGAVAIDLSDGLKRRGLTGNEMSIHVQDAVNSRKQLRPRVWTRTTTMPLGSLGSRQCHSVRQE